MKKFFLFAASAVALTVSCQKLQELVKPGSEPVDDTNPVEIKFNTNVVNVETKAALTALSSEETLYIYGLNTTQFEEGKEPTDLKQIINAPATSEVNAGSAGAAGESKSITWVGDNVHYYYRGTKDTYDFYGYYVGAAVTGTPEPDETTYELSVTITGNEDILLAKALGKDAKDDEGQPVAGAYSAMTARAEVVPTLQFEHQLSQFTFKVINGGKTDMTLKGISLNTVKEGILTVAGENAGLVAGTETGDFFLPGVNNNKLTGKTVNEETQEDVLTTVEFDGQSIMAFPQESYTVTLYLHQEAAVADGKVRTVSIPVKIADGAEAGSSYELTITIYSLEEVTLEATLVGWKEGSKIEIDSENTDNNANVDGAIGEGEVGWDEATGKPETPTPNPTATFTINKTDETVAVVGGEVEVTVTKTDDMAEVEAESSETWVTVTNHEDVYTLTVEENTTGEERSATVTFTDNEETTHTVSITQAGA